MLVAYRHFLTFPLVESEISRQRLQEGLGQLEGLVSELVTEKGEQVPSQDRSRSRGTSKRSSSKKVVKGDEIEKLMSEGWEPVMPLPDGRIVMRSM